MAAAYLSVLPLVLKIVAQSEYGLGRKLNSSQWVHLAAY